ncbi:MAG: hypothetical protein M3R72_10505 [Bacteroidota bacterium]|nr:hypothetical protein [Bacteroidota bacterium]
MKRMILIPILWGSVLACSAQTSQEWFQQKKTRIQYAALQLMAFQVYMSDLQKGYKTVKGGLNVIHDLKRGDFDLHHNYFGSLVSISEAVKGYDKVKGITFLQMQIVNVSKAIHKLFSSPFLLSSEQDYLRATFNNLLKKSSDDIDNANLLTTSNEAQLKESERLEGINDLYQSVKDKYTFAVHLQQSTQLLLLSRSKEKTNTSTLNSLYGLKLKR